MQLHIIIETNIEFKSGNMYFLHKYNLSKSGKLFNILTLTYLRNILKKFLV